MSCGFFEMPDEFVSTQIVIDKDEVWDKAASSETSSALNSTVHYVCVLLFLFILLQDYEYSSHNPVAYDIANHFCEMAADYHTDTPHILDYTKYPGKSLAQRFTWLHSDYNWHELSQSGFCNRNRRAGKIYHGVYGNRLPR